MSREQEMQEIADAVEDFLAENEIEVDDYGFAALCGTVDEHGLEPGDALDLLEDSGVLEGDDDDDDFEPEPDHDARAIEIAEGLFERQVQHGAETLEERLGRPVTEQERADYVQRAREARDVNVSTGVDLDTPAGREQWMAQRVTDLEGPPEIHGAEEDEDGDLAFDTDTSAGRVGYMEARLAGHEPAGDDE